jgi:hypothetical protein
VGGELSKAAPFSIASVEPALNEWHPAQGLANTAAFPKGMRKMSVFIDIRAFNAE